MSSQSKLVSKVSKVWSMKVSRCWVYRWTHEPCHRTTGQPTGKVEASESQVVGFMEHWEECSTSLSDWKLQEDHLPAPLCKKPVFPYGVTQEVPHTSLTSSHCFHWLAGGDCWEAEVPGRGWPGRLKQRGRQAEQGKTAQGHIQQLP